MNIVLIYFLSHFELPHVTLLSERKSPHIVVVLCIFTHRSCLVHRRNPRAQPSGSRALLPPSSSFPTSGSVGRPPPRGISPPCRRTIIFLLGFHREMKKSHQLVFGMAYVPLSPKGPQTPWLVSTLIISIQPGWFICQIGIREISMWSEKSQKFPNYQISQDFLVPLEKTHSHCKSSCLLVKRDSLD